MTGDPHYNNVSLLLHCDGANGSTTFTDTSPTPKTVTVAGNAQVSTAQSRFGGASALFDGTGDYLTVPNSSAFEFGASDLTIEFWMNTTTTTAYACLLSKDTSLFSPGAWAILINGTGSGAIQLWNASYNQAVVMLSAPSAAVNDGVWHHIAITRSGSSWGLYKDGALITSITWAGTMAALAVDFAVGRDSGFPARDFVGHIDEIRITKGVARYTSSFTPPSVALPDVAIKVSGVVRDSANALCARTVRAYDRTTGALLGSTTSNAVTGAYSIDCSTTSEVNVICLDDTAGVTENDLILRTTPG